jgi:hypothetical protein
VERSVEVLDRALPGRSGGGRTDPEDEESIVSQGERSPKILEVSWGHLDVAGLGVTKETPEAVKVYNDLADDVAVAGLFHSTC